MNKMSDEKEDKVELPRCKKCGSSFVYYRLKDNTRVCRKCGSITEVKEEE